jgi:hypothetical protein
MQSNRARIPLRRVNNDTLRVAIPLEFPRLHGLREGDLAVWIEEEGCVKLKFMKLAELEQVTEKMGTAASAEQAA